MSMKTNHNPMILILINLGMEQLKSNYHNDMIHH